MNGFEKPRIEKLAQEVTWWNAYKELYRAKGIDIAQLHAGQAVTIVTTIG